MWPHQFVNDGSPKVIGEEKVLDKMTRPIYAQKMSCIHCRKSFVRGREPQPIGQCPARSDQRELKRIKNG